MNPSTGRSENEFLPAEQLPNPQFDSFMQACLNNPAFFESMKQFYSQASQPKPPARNNNHSPYQANPYNPSLAYPAGLEQSRTNYDDADELESTSQKEIYKKETKKLPANPLLKYQPQEQVRPDNLNMQRKAALVQPEVKQAGFEEQPIKSRYIENISTNPSSKPSVDLNAIKENQSINVDFIERPVKAKQAVKEPVRNFDDQPIRSMKTEDVQREYRDDDRPIKGMSQTDLELYQQYPEKTVKTSLSSNTSKAAANSKVLDDDRPLTGAKKDFKQLIKQQFPQPFGQQIEQQQPEERKVEPRNFLKRGSRQHLSSAMNKSKQPKKKEEDDLNKSGLDRSRDLTPKNQRSVSQNRVLGKRNNRDNNNDKSINKGIAKNQPQNEDTINSRAKPPLNNNKKVVPAANKPSNTPKAQPTLSKKKKGKNVFDDNSSSSSSEEQPYFKATTSNKPSLAVEADDDRTQVIDGVFLTNEQLDLILQKYGKAIKAPPKETESEKIQAIRNKYTELCQLVESEREAHQLQLQREKEQFEKYKADQLNKIKNQRRVMERQLKSGSSNQNLQKDREELETLKQDLQRQREDFKKKDKTNRIMIEKYKKENEQLKAKIERLELQRDSVVGSKRSLNTYKEQPLEEKSTVIRGSGKATTKKIQQEPLKEQVSYRDIKKGKETTKEQPGKMKYEYMEEQPVIKNKPTNVQREVKIQNKWVSNKFNSDSDSPSQHEEEQQEKAQASSGPEWSPTMKLSDLTKIDLSIKMVTEQMINSLFRYDTNLDYRRYQQLVKAPGRTIVNSTRNNKNSFMAHLYSDRSKEHIYDNGTRKETLQNGYTIIYFKNGDIKQTLPDQTILYYFKEKAVDQITLPNNVNIYRFENNQVEFHFPNGYIEIRHPDGTIKVLGEHTRR